MATEIGPRCFRGQDCYQEKYSDVSEPNWWLHKCSSDPSPPGVGGQFLAPNLGGYLPPVFSCCDADWETFSQEWDLYEAVLRQVNRGNIPEVLLLRTYSRSLDQAGRNVLALHQRENPIRTLAQFNRELCHMNSRDQPLCVDGNGYRSPRVIKRI